MSVVIVVTLNIHKRCLFQHEGVIDMRRIFIGILFTMSVSHGFAASFDCAKASTLVEHAICADPHLSRLDEVLADNYKHMAAANIGAGALINLKATQRSWMAQRNKCTSSQCIASSYKSRIDTVCNDYPVLSGMFPSCTSSEDAESALESATVPGTSKAKTVQDKPTASNNEQKIKALGLSSDFLNSTLYVNYLGRWQPLMPCAQWLSMVLDNKRVASIEKHSVGDHPGINIKTHGNPAVGILFRLEGKEAFLYAFDEDDEVTVLNTPSEQSSAALALKAFSDGVP